MGPTFLMKNVPAFKHFSCQRNSLIRLIYKIQVFLTPFDNQSLIKILSHCQNSNAMMNPTVGLDIEMTLIITLYPPHKLNGKWTSYLSKWQIGQKGNFPTSQNIVQYLFWDQQQQQQQQLTTTTMTTMQKFVGP